MRLAALWSRGAEPTNEMRFFVVVAMCDLWRRGREELKHTNELRFFTDVVLCDLRRCGREELKHTNVVGFFVVVELSAPCGHVVERS